jgi:hypothetical protein
MTSTTNSCPAETSTLTLSSGWSEAAIAPSSPSTIDKQLDAEGAKELGLVHEVLPHEELLAAADAWCRRIAELAMEEFAEPQCLTTDAFQQSVQELLRAR